MSEENVETLNRIAAAWNRGDLEAWLGFSHPRSTGRGASPGWKARYIAAAME